jgi:hypothetical protein
LFTSRLVAEENYALFASGTITRPATWEEIVELAENNVRYSIDAYGVCMLKSGAKISLKEAK